MIDAIVDAVQEARRRKASLRIIGAGTWLNAGGPVLNDSGRIETLALTGITEYAPDDLTLTAKAGTSLAEIERVTLDSGQWLPLDPFGVPNGTLGATVATASYGPLASAFGTPRDQVLGCEFVSGKGEVIRAGGKVVKNVAGFDLVRLITGSWGTLGVATEVTVRLRALPEIDRTFAVECTAGAAWRWLRASELTPFAAEMISATLSRVLGVGTSECLLVRIGGNAELVRVAEESIAGLGPSSVVETGVWSRLAVSEPASSVVVRFSTLPSKVGELFGRVSTLAGGSGGFAHATLERGVVRCVLGQPDADHSALAILLESMRGSAILVAERLPRDMWNSMRAHGMSSGLSERVVHAFDPDRVLNRGVL